MKRYRSKAININYRYDKIVPTLMFFYVAVQLLDAIIAVDEWQPLQIYKTFAT